MATTIKYDIPGLETRRFEGSRYLGVLYLRQDRERTNQDLQGWNKPWHIRTVPSRYRGQVILHSNNHNKKFKSYGTRSYWIFVVLENNKIVPWSIKCEPCYISNFGPDHPNPGRSARSFGRAIKRGSVKVTALYDRGFLKKPGPYFFIDVICIIVSPVS